MIDLVKRKWWWPSLALDIAAIGLAAVTWMLFAHVDAYRSVGNELLGNPSFQTGFSGWHVTGHAAVSSPGAVVLSGQRGSAVHVISQTLRRPASGYLRVSVDADLRNIVHGPKPWESARIDVMGLDANGHEHWDFPHKLFAITGSRSLRDYARVFQIPAAYERIRVEAELVGATGTFVIKHLSAMEARPIPAVANAKRAVLVAWILLVSSVVMILIWRKSWRLAIALLPGGALLLFIPDGLRLFVERVMTVNGLNLSLDHLALFTVMTWLALRDHYAGAGGRLEPVVHLAVLGVIVEAIQYYLPGRSSEFVDILSDWLGIGLALVGYEIALRLRASSRKPSELHL